MSSHISFRWLACLVLFIWCELNLAGFGRAEEKRDGVIPVAIDQNNIYSWSIDTIPLMPEHDLAVRTTLTTARLEKGGAALKWLRIPIDCFLFTGEDKRRHQFPLRWATDSNGVQMMTFFYAEPKPRFVPTDCKAVRIRSEIITSDPSKPTSGSDAELGFQRQEGRLYVSGSIDPPLSTNIQPAFVAAYEDSTTNADLITLQNSTGGQPPFTFDFAPPRGASDGWTIYVQRVPMKSIDVVTFYPDREKDKRVARIERFAVPFSEPFFAHRTKDGTIFLVTERSGSVVEAKPPATGMKEWTVKTIWAGTERPVRVFVRDGSQRAFAITDQEIFMLSEEFKPVKHEAGLFQAKSTDQMDKLLEKGVKLVISKR